MTVSEQLSFLICPLYWLPSPRTYMTICLVAFTLLGLQLQHPGAWLAAPLPVLPRQRVLPLCADSGTSSKAYHGLDEGLEVDGHQEQSVPTCRWQRFLERAAKEAQSQHTGLQAESGCQKTCEVFEYRGPASLICSASCH